MEIIQKRNLSEAVAEQLLSLISTGKLKAGGKLPTEAQLCQTLGVSRTAVREGIRALAGTNVLTALPGRGTFVNKNPGIMVNNDALKMFLDRETVKSIYEVRRVLDVGIAQLAALRANEEDIKALHKAVKKMEKSLESDPYDFELGMEANEEFHLAFCEAAHNKILENIAWPIINHNMMSIWKKLDDSLEIVKARIKDHKEILEGVEKRDSQGVVNAVLKHLKGAFDRISVMSDTLISR
jgi:GntR family transcriptional repressor for pyruvate dehydrogenase complex